MIHPTIRAPIKPAKKNIHPPLLPFPSRFGSGSIPSLFISFSDQRFVECIGLRREIQSGNLLKNTKTTPLYTWGWFRFSPIPYLCWGKIPNCLSTLYPMPRFLSRENPLDLSQLKPDGYLHPHLNYLIPSFAWVKEPLSNPFHRSPI